MAIRQGGLYRRPAPGATAELVQRTKPAPIEDIPAGGGGADTAAAQPQGGYSPGPSAELPAAGSAAAGKPSRKKGA